MESNTFNKIHKCFNYKIKEGTSTSFALIEGEKNILPDTLSLYSYDGRQGNIKSNHQLKGRYKKNEQGFYHHINDRRLHTKLIELNGYPKFIGYGEIDKRFGIYDLVIISSNNDCKKDFCLHIFKDFAFPSQLPSFLPSAVDYVLNFSK